MVMVTVGKIVRAHGVRGEVVVEVHTDVPEERFVAGALVTTEVPARASPGRSAAATSAAPGTGSAPAALTVTRARWHQGRLLVQFDSVVDRTSAEGLRGLLLRVEVDDNDALGGPDEYFDRQLVGLSVVTVSGDAVGEVEEIMHGAGQDVLMLRAPDGAEVLVPFVAEIVPEVDMASGKLVIAPPPGLLELPRSGDTA